MTTEADRQRGERHHDRLRLSECANALARVAELETELQAANVAIEDAQAAARAARSEAAESWRLLDGVRRELCEVQGERDRHKAWSEQAEARASEACALIEGAEAERDEARAERDALRSRFHRLLRALDEWAEDGWTPAVMAHDDVVAFMLGQDAGEMRAALDSAS